MNPVEQLQAQLELFKANLAEYQSIISRLKATEEVINYVYSKMLDDIEDLQKVIENGRQALKEETA